MVANSIFARRPLKHEEVFYEQRWKFLEGGGNRGFTLAPNNYTYEFSVPLEASLPESVEGLGATHIIYRLKARVVRGMLAHDIVAKKVRGEKKIAELQDPSANFIEAHADSTHASSWSAGAVADHGRLINS